MLRGNARIGKLEIFSTIVVPLKESPAKEVLKMLTDIETSYYNKIHSPCKILRMVLAGDIIRVILQFHNFHALSLHILTNKFKSCSFNVWHQFRIYFKPKRIQNLVEVHSQRDEVRDSMIPKSLHQNQKFQELKLYSCLMNLMMTLLSCSELSI